MLLALEQEAYEGEGVDFSRVEWRSNEDTLAALDARPGNAGVFTPSSSSSSAASQFSVGLLALLDEACLVPGGSDKGFGLRVSEVLAAGGGSSSSSAASSAASTPSSAKALAAKASSDFASSSSSSHFSSSVISGCPAGAGSSFSVAHAAGTVSYSTSGFLSKNKDVVSAEALALLSRFSAEPLLKEIAEAATRTARKSSSKATTNSGTVVSAFRHQLRSLLSRLDASQLHFVRCIKPNSRAAARSFDAALVAHQLRCAGVAEVARVARQGFPTRLAYSELAGRFYALLPQAMAAATGEDDKTVVSALLSPSCLSRKQQQLGGDDFALGRTKVFMRAGVLTALESELRIRSAAATAISSRFRGCRQRARYLRMRGSAVAIQAAVRGRAARNLLKAMRREEEEKRRLEEEEAKAAAGAAAAAAAKSTIERSRSSSSTTSSVENPADAADSVLRGAENLVEAADAEAAAAARRAAASGGEAKKSGKWLQLPKVPLSLRRSSRSNEGGGGSAASIAPRPPASGVAEVALWEAYSERLEAQVACLLRTNRALQGSLAASRADAAATAAGSTNGGRKKSCFSSCVSSVPSSSPTRSAAAEHAASLRALDALHEALGRREALFADDVAFLEEVASGAVAAAPEFHLFEETKRLRRRFSSFVGSFEKKMEATEVVVLGAAEAREEDASVAAVGGESESNLIAACPPLQGGKERTGAAVVALEARAAW